MRNLEKGQHIFIAFQNGKAVLDSQLRPRIYTSLENADKWTPTVNKGKIEYVEYAPTLTPPNEWVSVEERLPEDDAPAGRKQITVMVATKAGKVTIASRVFEPERESWGKVYPARWIWSRWLNNHVTHWMNLPAPPDRRPPEGEEKT